MAVASLDEYLEKLDELATISPVALELIKKINNPSVTRSEIAGLVASDEILCANVFKYVKSAAFGLRVIPDSIDQAIDFLGMYNLRDLVFLISAKKVFQDVKLWCKSLFIAFAAREFSEQLDYKPSEASKIYIASLMSSMGELIFKTFYTQDYKKVDQTVSYEDRLIEEENVFGISSSNLTFEIAKEYGLPQGVIEILASQRFDWQSDDFSQTNSLIYVARLLAENKCDQQKYIDMYFSPDLKSQHNLFDLSITESLLKKINDKVSDFVSF